MKLYIGKTPGYEGFSSPRGTIRFIPMIGDRTCTFKTIIEYLCHWGKDPTKNTVNYLFWYPGFVKGVEECVRGFYG